MTPPDHAGSQTKICDFSLEALVQFKDDHCEHSAHQVVPKPTSVRPNYDNRKRRFEATQPPERKTYLEIVLEGHYVVSIFRGWLPDRFQSFLPFVGAVEWLNF